jgi:hypothetical protein
MKRRRHIRSDPDAAEMTLNAIGVIFCGGILAAVAILVVCGLCLEWKSL